MRTNSENPLLYEPRISGARYHNVVIVLTATLVIPSDGPTVWVVNGGASNRVVRLPALRHDKQVVLANVGTTNDLEVTDSSGGALISIPPNMSAIFFGGTSRWVWLIDTALSYSISPTVITVSGAVAATDIEVQVNGAGAVVLTLPLSAVWAASVGSRGFPLSIYDISGNASVNNITINPSGGQTISGNASLTISNDYGGWRLRPRTGGGWIFQ